MRSGPAAAILLGDLCLSWADELLYGSGLADAALRSAKPVFDVMRTELMAGQYLDLLEQATRRRARSSGAMRVLRYKSAKYTVERPLQLGAALAGGAAPDCSRRTARTACRWARRSSCATTCSACSATRRRPASRPATTCARASARVLVAFALAEAAPAGAAAAAPPPRRPGPGRGRRRRRCARSSRPAGRSRGSRTLIAGSTEQALDALEQAGPGLVAEPGAWALAELAHAATVRTV